MSEPAAVDRKLATRLVLDELFDLSLYQSLREVASGELRSILDRLIPIEARHLAFWQDFFDLHVERLDIARRLKLCLIIFVCRLFGAPAIHLVLEAIEVYGVRKYLRVWTTYGNGPLGAAVRSVLEDEFEHEDAVVMGDAERRLNPERVRNIFLGLNDGLVEILGAVSGFLRRLRQFSRGAGRGRHGGRGGGVVHGSRRLGRDERRGGSPGDRDGPATVPG
jgi:hypothetical protein